MSDRTEELRERLAHIRDVQIVATKNLQGMTAKIAADFEDMDTTAFNAILADEVAKTERAIEALA